MNPAIHVILSFQLIWTASAYIHGPFRRKMNPKALCCTHMDSSAARHQPTTLTLTRILNHWYLHLLYFSFFIYSHRPWLAL